MPTTRHRWPEIERCYVQGREVNGAREYPSLAELAREFGVSHQYLQQRCAAGGWSEKRQKFLGEIEAKAAEIASTTLAKQSATFDLSCFDAAKRLVLDIGRQIEKGSLSLAARSSLASALVNAQRVGRLALGDSVENVKQLTLPSGVFRIAGREPIATEQQDET
jgi:hypothetical protein